MKKRLMSLAMVLIMCLSMALPALAAECEKVQITVANEDELLAFLKSPQFDRNKSYTFITVSPITLRIICPSCGYNTLRGVTIRDFNPDDPGGQGRTYGCPYNKLSPDVVTEMCVYTVQQCTTCGYEQGRIFREIEYHIVCSEGPKTDWIATDYKTEEHRGDIHEWKDYWDGTFPRGK